MSHRITVESGEALPKAVLEGLMDFNQAIAGPSNLQQVGLAMRADDGSVMAGLVGLSYWNMLRIDLLWVAPAHRRFGCGTALLQRAEQIAIERGCEIVFLSTYSFQAPEFYTQHGYRAFGVLENAPAGFSTTWFAKRVAAVGSIEPAASRS